MQAAQSGSNRKIFTKIEIGFRLQLGKQNDSAGQKNEPPKF